MLTDEEMFKAYTAATGKRLSHHESERQAYLKSHRAIERLVVEKLTELNARIDDRNAALLSKTVELSECQKQRDELLETVAAWEQKAANWMASPEAVQRLDGYRDIAQRLNVAEQKRDELLARIDVVCEVHIISQTYDRIREERQFAADDMEYDLFAAGWKAAIANVKEKP